MSLYFRLKRYMVPDSCFSKLGLTYSRQRSCDRWLFCFGRTPALFKPEFDQAVYLGVVYIAKADLNNANDMFEVLAL